MQTDHRWVFSLLSALQVWRQMGWWWSRKTCLKVLNLTIWTRVSLDRFRCWKISSIEADSESSRMRNKRNFPKICSKCECLPYSDPISYISRWIGGSLASLVQMRIIIWFFHCQLAFIFYIPYTNLSFAPLLVYQWLVLADILYFIYCQSQITFLKPFRPSNAIFVTYFFLHIS